MSDGANAPALREFIAELNRARCAAGPPTYAELERRSKHCEAPYAGPRPAVQPLRVSTTHDILTGRRRGLPRWQWVASFITVLHVLAAEAGLDPAAIGALEEWKARHEAADAALDAARRAARVRVHAGGGTPRTADRESRHARRETGALAMARRSVATGWWRAGHRDVVPEWEEPCLSLESAANLIRVYGGHRVPALLQTREYAMAALRLDRPGLPARSLARRADLMMRRRTILSKSNSAKLWAIIDEAALRAPIDRAIMRAQVVSLIRSSERPGITVQVLPQKTSGGTAAGDPVVLLRFPESEFSDIVYLEHLTGGLYLDNAADVNHFSQVLSRSAIEALRPPESRAFLREFLI
ncbi:transcriptional regulator [Spongiactinospora gelatinilytica]|uniref:Transcriptional regulator n=1 Tax=Spongiactinospora gelatinilytica TaxID=2666298 RepID=A0A2W2GVY2_9ACTN|nr:DUF5753 domain-containing protein [Spongiactinospora gelatinilytica]PZG41418.1 transcriptional regulator [Spongiactinospora gelatinilytica]